MTPAEASTRRRRVGAATEHAELGIARGGERPAAPMPPPPSLDPVPSVAAGSLHSIGGLSRWVVALPIAAAISSLTSTLVSLGVQDDVDAFRDGETDESDFLESIAPVTAIMARTRLRQRPVPWSFVSLKKRRWTMNRPGFGDCSGYWVTASRAVDV